MPLHGYAWTAATRRRAVRGVPGQRREEAREIGGAIERLSQLQKRPTQHGALSRKYHAASGVSMRVSDAPEWAALASEADIFAPNWRGSLRSLPAFAFYVNLVQDSDDSMAFTSSKD
jgi:hypothetical protein